MHQTIQATPRRRSSRLGAVAVLAIALGACVPDEPPRLTAEAPPVPGVALVAQAGDAAQSVAAPRSPVDDLAAIGERDGDASAPSAMASLVPPAAPAPPPAPPPGLNIDPAQLVGMTPREVRTLLGDPSFRRVDQPSLIWQYRGRACILDVFLYRDRTDYRVTQVAVRSRKLEPRDTGILTVSGDACFFGLLRARPSDLLS